MTGSSSASRRLLQFSLRKLLLAMFVVAVFLCGRESGRRLLEAERKAADAARDQAETALANARLSALAQQLVLNRRELRAAEVERDRQLLLVERLEQSLANAELTKDLLIRNSWNGNWSPAEPPTLAPPIVDSPRQRVFINEYWHRNERTRRYPHSPRMLDRWSANS